MKSKKGDCPVEIHSLEKVWISKEQSPSYISGAKIAITRQPQPVPILVSQGTCPCLVQFNTCKKSTETCGCITFGFEMNRFFFVGSFRSFFCH